VEGCNDLYQKDLNIFVGYGLMLENTVQRSLRASCFPMIGGGASDIMRPFALAMSARIDTSRFRDLEQVVTWGVHDQTSDHCSFHCGLVCLGVATPRLYPH
jgi:hypothetical protein